MWVIERRTKRLRLSSARSEPSPCPAHRAEKWTRFSASDDALFKERSIGLNPKSGSTFWSDARLRSARSEPSPCPAHRAEKWTRFSASDDALFKERSIGLNPKSGSTFWSDALACSTVDPPMIRYESSQSRVRYGMPTLPVGYTGRQALLHGMRSANPLPLPVMWQSQPAEGQVLRRLRHEAEPRCRSDATAGRLP